MSVFKSTEICLENAMLTAEMHKKDEMDTKDRLKRIEIKIEKERKEKLRCEKAEKKEKGNSKDRGNERGFEKTSYTFN
uniref:Uncharacterized protein n=1 Tax=Strongyloides venezuelensis TaxID=75913 RepID=A0A0K0F2Z0_STRVS